MIDPVSHLPDGAKHVVDGFALLAFVAHTIGIALPPLVSLLTIIWLALRIWESSTVQGFVGRWRSPKP